MKLQKTAAKTAGNIILVGTLCLISGCIQMKDALILNADGSGTWQLTMTYGAQLMGMMESGGNMDHDIFMHRDQLEKVVKGIKGARIASYDLQKEPEEMTVSMKIAFDSIEEMMSSEMGKPIGWYFEKRDNLFVATLSKGLMETKNNSDDTIQMGGQEQFAMIKGMMMGMKVQRQIVLPNTITTTNAMKRKGRAAGWVMEIKPDTKEEEFTKLSELKPEAVCLLKGITFKLPLKPSGPKPALDAVKTDPATASKLAGQVNIKPTSLTITRRKTYEEKPKGFFGGPMSTTLSLALQWPENLRPVGYTDLQVEEAIDDTGTALKCTSSSGDQVHNFNLQHDKTDTVSLDLNFKAPPPKNASSISLRGSITLHIPGEMAPVKVPNIKTMVGKQISTPGVEHLQMTLKSLDDKPNNHEFVFESPVDLSSVAEVKIVSVDLSQEFKSWFVHNMRWGQGYMLKAGFNKIPENPTFVFVVSKDVARHRIPFEFKNLELP